MGDEAGEEAGRCPVLTPVAQMLVGDARGVMRLVAQEILRSAELHDQGMNHAKDAAANPATPGVTILMAELLLRACRAVRIKVTTKRGNTLTAICGRHPMAAEQAMAKTRAERSLGGRASRRIRKSQRRKRSRRIRHRQGPLHQHRGRAVEQEGAGDAGLPGEAFAQRCREPVDGGRQKRSAERGGEHGDDEERVKRAQGERGEELRQSDQERIARRMRAVDQGIEMPDAGREQKLVELPEALRQGRDAQSGDGQAESEQRTARFARIDARACGRPGGGAHG